MWKVIGAFAAGGIVAVLATLAVMKRGQTTPETPAVAAQPVAATQAMQTPEAPEPAAVAMAANPVREQKPAPMPPPRQIRRQPETRPEAMETAKVQAPPPVEEAKAPPPVAKPVPAPAVPPTPPAPAESPILKPERSLSKPEPRQPREATIPAGTLLQVRLSETLSSERLKAGDSFSATIDQPLVVDGFVIAERGARAEGKVIDAVRAGRVKGVARLAIQLTRFQSSDGQSVDVQTEPFIKEALASRGSDAAKVGVAAGLGAAIGAIAGGGKGAAIGAAAGGAAGAGGVLATRGKPAELQVETRIGFRLNQPVTLREKLN